jgi:hypothetical protein
VGGGCGLSTFDCQSLSIPSMIPFQDIDGNGCRFIIFDDRFQNCTGDPDNVIAQSLGLDECIRARQGFRDSGDVID